MIGLGGVSVFLYSEAASDLERWLQGAQQNINPTNIYAAPLSLIVGQRVTLAQAVDHLRQAGYIEIGAGKEPGRGSYKIDDHTLEVRPGESAMGRDRTFIPVRINFNRNNLQITQIVDIETNRSEQQCQLEPVILSTITRSPGHLDRPTERGIRFDLTYNQIPTHLVNAVVAIEDKTFFEHSGVSPWAILRAFWRNFQEGETVEGGSTITQQVIKNILVGSEKSYRRKLREAFLALALENHLSKEEIFAQYANIMYLGHRGGLSVYGLGAAAREYFDKDVSKLDLAEAALLAGMIHRPGYYLVQGREKETIGRRNQVLKIMGEEGMISASEVEKAMSAPIELQFRPGPGDTDITTPYFIDFVQEQVFRLVPPADLATAGYRIYTTLDQQIQRAASIAVAEGLAVVDRDLRQRKPPIPPGTVQGAMVVLDAQSGSILAMVGGRNYSESQFNRVISAKRQPGSAIKPFVYLAALAFGVHETTPITLATMYEDKPRTFEEDYAPQNIGGKYLERVVTVREALTRSLNVITVQIAQETGYGEVAGMINRCGLSRPEANASIALGTSEVTPLELASAYSVFVTGGRRITPMGIFAVRDSKGALVRRVQTESQEVVSAQVAFLCMDVLRDVVRRPYGTAHAAATLGDSVLAGKTGTSQRSDAWFAGLNPKIIAVTWIGFDDNRPLDFSGSRAALPIWISFMRQVQRLRPDLLEGSFEPPEGIIERPIDPTTGLLATERCPQHEVEYFIEGREIAGFCPDHPGPPLVLSPEPATDAPEEPVPEPEDPSRRTRPRRVKPPGSPG